MIGPVLAGLLALSAHAEERRYALVVGNNRGDADEVALQYASRDASRVAEVLQQLGGVSAADVVLLHNPDASQLRQVFDRLDQRIAAERGPDDRSVLFIYYSGHADADALHMSGTRMPLAELKDRTEAASADARLLVIDACRAGAITRAKGATPIAPFEIDLGEEESTSEGFAIITAAAPGEDAQESDRLQGGVFTHHFISGLQGAADASGDHVVSLREAFEYSRSRTTVATSQAPIVQHPRFKWDMSGGEDLPLTRLDGARRTGQLVLGLGGEYIVFEPRATRIVAEFEVDRGGTLVLPEGRYVLRRRTPSRVYQADIRIDEGDVTRVEDSLLQQLPYGQTARRGGAAERHVALSVTGGAIGIGPLRDGMGRTLGGVGGLRLDTPYLTADLRGRYSLASGSNDYLTVDQRGLAIDAGAYRLWDVARLAGGAGLRVGAERLDQTFTTDGVAPDRTTYALYASPIVRGEVALTPRVSLGVEGGLSAYILPYTDEQSSLTAVPYAAMDLSVVAF